MKTNFLRFKTAFRTVMLMIMLVIIGITRGVAERVSPKVARNVATTFFNNNGVKSSTVTDISKAAGFSNLYIFNAENSFVILSADDQFEPILGYSLTGCFVAENMPDDLYWWLNGYNDDIQYVVDNNIKAASGVTQIWNDLKNSKSDAGKSNIVVDELLETRWHQDFPYNKQCPNNCATGCVATAMAQIMKKWNYPTQGIGGYYYKWNNTLLSGYFSTTTYDWSNMDNVYNSSGNGIVHDDAVATLMFHCGVSVETDYGTEASSAYMFDVPVAMKENFGYSNDVEYKQRSSVASYDTWIAMMKADLDNGWPLLYGGDPDTIGGEGHCFVCDGYDSVNKFHFNFGWRNTDANGYFLISEITYNQTQDAVFKIHPSECDAPTKLSATVEFGRPPLTLNQNNVHLTWTAAESVGSYRIYRDDVMIESAVIGTSYVDRDLEVGDHIYYLASNCAGGGMSTVSNTVIAEVDFPGNITITDTIGGLRYSLNTQKHVAQVIGYYDKSSYLCDIIIPSSVTYNNATYIVTSIGDDAFYRCSKFVSGTIPNTVTNIEDRAFYECFLTSLTIPNSVTRIGGEAFYGCSGLTSLTIPNSVTHIGAYAFYDCNNITTVYWNAVNITGYPSVTNPFRNCANLRTVVFGESVQTIPERAFYECYFLTSVTIPNSVTSIGYGAFEGCSELTSVTIPNSVTSIGGNAFQGCSGLTSVTIPNSVTSIGGGAFQGCSGLTSLTIPNSVTHIGGWAFRECSGLTTVYWNAVNVTSYPDSHYHPFKNCINLRTVVFGDYVETIPVRAFFGCSGLTSLTIGNSVTSIGRSAFAGCNGLTSMTVIAETPPAVGYNAFGYVTTSIPINVPCGTQDIYQTAYYWSEFENIYDSPYNLILIQNDPYGGEVSIHEWADCEDGHCTILAEPSIGYTFNGWYVDDEFITSSELYEFSLTEDVCFEARFTRNENHYIANGTSNIWSNPDTWDTGEVPTEASTVAIYKNIVIDVDANVSAMGVYDDNSITITPDVILTVEDELVSDNASSIIIEDGGQIIHSSEDVMATIEQTIEPIASDDDGWNLISYPLLDNGTVASVTNILSNEYDLFAYDEPSYTWLNQKNENNNFTELEAGMGYLYANSGKAVDNPKGTKIGEGTSTIGYTPFCTLYNYSISENLFLASELEAAGLSTTELGALCWYAANQTGYQQNNISIWMANVSDSGLSSTSHNVSEMTLVYTGGMTPVIGWNEFVFNENTFTWDGTSNILVCVQRNNGAWNSTVYWQAHNPGFAALSYKYNDDSAYDMTSATYSMTVSSSSRPNTIFQTVEQIGKENYEPITMSFAGEIVNGTAEITVPLSYTSGNTLSGFNLVGNPYAHNVTSYEGYKVANGCYRLNDAKTNLIISMVSEEDPLKVGEGFFVKATGNDASVTFNPSTRNTDDEKGLVCLEVNKNDRTLDRVYLQMNESEGLDKMVLPNYKSLLYFVDGGQPMAILPHHAKAYNLFFDATENGTFTIESALLGAECEYLHLIDRITGDDIDLLSTPSYTFEAKTSDITNRFALVLAEGEQPEAVTEVEQIREIVPVLPPHGSDNDEPAGSQTAVTQTINLVSGTNWFSANVEITLDDLKAALVAASPNAAITIKSQTQKATYNPSNGRWTGRLTTFDLSQMYKITVGTACEITFEGVRINPAEHPVTITPGANWIAYPLNTSKTPQEIFTGFAVPGDMVKSQSQKKQYNSNGRWSGRLGSLEPGKGYIYTSSATEDRVFTFPMSTE